MNYATGDIVINNNGTWGHALMCYEGGSRPKFIHATNSGNFHIATQMSEKDGHISYLFDRNCDHFRAKKLSGAKQVELQWVATQIAAHAKYGLYRAVRLAIGSSVYGNKARERLEKYRSRLGGTGDKLVTTLTCSEAVVLCYQLTFVESAAQFILLDAAHALPRTVGAYLKNSANWEHTPL